MKKDWLGNSVTGAGNETLAGINDFIEGFLAYENKAANILQAVEKDPDSCMANAYAALFYMFLESKDAPRLARPYIEKAESLAKDTTRREQMNVAAIRAWVDNDIPQAIDLSEDIVTEFPRDLAIVKSAQYHQFNLGNCAGMLKMSELVFDKNTDVPYMHGLVAFGYEQCHLLEDAEIAARRAIEMKRKEPWAHHALAHVMITQGRIQEGIDFLMDVSDTWVDLNSFMVTHNWWHVGLNLISQGRNDETLKLYDEKVWGVWKEYSQDQIGAVSLLMRLELVGVDVGDRWKDLGAFLKVRSDDFVQPFLTMQYIYGLARAELSEADVLMENLRAFSRNVPEFVRDAWQNVAVTACEGLLAHARGDHMTAFAKMSVAQPRLLEIGGSHAQRGLFDQGLLDCMIKTGRYAQAQQFLEEGRAHNPMDKPTNNKLVNVYTQLGLGREAAQARARLAA